MKINQRPNSKGRKQNLIFACFFGLFTCFLFFLVSCQSPTPPQGTEVKVLRAISGQTLEVMGTGQQSALIQRVRLIGIETPDLKQKPWGLEAKKRLEEAIAGQIVLLESDVEPKDSFERTLAYVWKDNLLLNEQLLLEGRGIFQSQLNTKYDRRLERAQEWARVMGRGIWNPEKPMRLTPSEFRSQYR